MARETIAQVAEAVTLADEPSHPSRLEQATLLSQQKIAKALTRLEDAGLVETLSDGRVQTASQGVDTGSAIDTAVRDEDQRRAADRERVEQMRAYAELGACRRAFLLSHFGERYEVPYDNCDACERLRAARGDAQSRP